MFLTLKKKKRSTTRMNFKRKHENVYQTRKLTVTNIFPRFSSKSDRRDDTFSLFQQNSEQIKQKLGCHNLHQLELYTKPTWRKLDNFEGLLGIFSFKYQKFKSYCRTQRFLSDLRSCLSTYSTTGNTEFHKLDQQFCLD